MQDLLVTEAHTFKIRIYMNINIAMRIKIKADKSKFDLTNFPWSNFQIENEDWSFKKRQNLKYIEMCYTYITFYVFMEKSLDK